MFINLSFFYKQIVKIEFQDLADHKGKIKLKATFEHSAIHLTETLFGTIINMDGCGIKGKIGGPGLPSQVIRVALPPLINIVTVHGTPLNKILLNDGENYIAPVQFSMIAVNNNGSHDNSIKIDDKTRNKLLQPREQLLVQPYPPPPTVPPDPTLYKNAVEQPLPLVRLINTGQIGMTPIAVLEINPVKLLQNGALELYSEISISLEYRSLDLQSSIKNDASKRISLFDSTIRSRCQAKRSIELACAVVVNPEYVIDFSKDFPDLITNVDYLVVTDSWKWDRNKIRRITKTLAGTFLLPGGVEKKLGATPDSITGAFQRLVDWKRKRGIKAQVVTVSDIVDGKYGNFVKNSRDLQEVIRNFLKWAYHRWGISWVLLGGDTDIIPVRIVAGGANIRDGYIDVQNMDPPADNKSFWTGKFLKIKVGSGSSSPGWGWPGTSSSMPLVRFDTGLRIPYDDKGSSGPTNIGWYFTTDSSYATRSSIPTPYIRVNGPETQIKGRMQWLYEYNTIPTDLYYSSIVGSNYDIYGKHDWDLLDNGIYGQYAGDTDFDGVSYNTDISVGRAPISNADEANAFVNKIIAYEQFRSPDGVLLDRGWPSRMLFVSCDWWPGLRINPMPYVGPRTPLIPHENNYYHEVGQPYSLIRLKSDTNFISDFYKFTPRLFAVISDTDVRVIPYRSDHASARGWNFVRGFSDLSVSELKLDGFKKPFPMPTHWVAVYGLDEELSPLRYVFDQIGQDFSMEQQEDLRRQMALDSPNISNISRLYEDEVDLSLAEQAAAPVDHFTIDRLRDSLNHGQHFVSLSGHGSPEGGCCGLGRYMANNLRNGYNSFIGYADSCLTNAFDVSDAVSENLVYNPNGGAVGYVGNTRFSLIFTGDNFQRAFFHRLTSTNHLGLLNDIRCTLVHEPPNIAGNKWTIFTQNLIGDPEMPIWKGAPKILKISHPRALDSRKLFTVKIDPQSFSNDYSPEDVTVHIQQENFSRITHMDSSGTATFDINMAQLGKLDITVTHAGFIPCIDIVHITGPFWISGVVTEIKHHSDTQQSRVRLQLDQSIENSSYRFWNICHSGNDSSILNAVTNAYVSEKKISLFVDNLEEGGNVEGFCFGVADLDGPN